jgi:hypothetical protein
MVFFSWTLTKGIATMDITRNWRLKMARSQLLGVRSPTTGTIILPHQTGSARCPAQEIYHFETAAEDSSPVCGYAEAVR